MNQPATSSPGLPVSACQRIAEDWCEYGRGTTSTLAVAGRRSRVNTVYQPAGTAGAGTAAAGRGISGSTANAATARGAARRIHPAGVRDAVVRGAVVWDA